MGGNIGVPALDLLDRDCELYVLELSSFQLERCHQLSPNVASVLNLSPDHLDRHNTYADYQRAKLSIYDRAEIKIFNRNDDMTKPKVTTAETCLSFGVDDPGASGFGVRVVQGESWLVDGTIDLMPLAQLAMKGGHNVANALAALGPGAQCGFTHPSYAGSIENICGLASSLPGHICAGRCRLYQ